MFLKPTSSKAHGTSKSAAASWSAVTEMRGRSLASAAPLSSSPELTNALTAFAKRCRASLATALQDAAAPFICAGAIVVISLLIAGCEREAKFAQFPAQKEDEKPAWSEWMAKGTDADWWKQQSTRASEAAKAAKASLDSINVTEVKKLALEITQAIERQDFSEVESLAVELGKHLSVEHLAEGMRFIIIQRQKGGEAATRAIEEYAKKPDLSEFEKTAAENLKKGLNFAQSDDVQGCIFLAIFFAAECKLGAHRGGLIAIPIMSILFPEYLEKHGNKP